MPIDIVKQSDPSESILIKISGKFDFNAQKEFEFVAHEVLTKYRMLPIKIDLARTEYIDSSAISFLFKFRDSLGEDRPRMRLTGARGMVKLVLDTVNAHYLFDIDGHQP